jgi:hypothetical protein
VDVFELASVTTCEQMRSFERRSDQHLRVAGGSLARSGRCGKGNPIQVTTLGGRATIFALAREDEIAYSFE